MNTKEKLASIIDEALKLSNIEKIEYIIEVPNDKKNGDFSTNVAMELTKILKKNPRIIAEELVANINKNNIIDRIDIAGPGFINFYLNKAYLLNGINEIIKLDSNYGKSTIGNNKKINIEYVSANPTGILHVGTARGASYGDNISRIMSFAGYDVTREYYINDGGNQINNLGKSIKARYDNICGINTEMPEDGYHGEEIIEIAKSIYKENKDSKINEKIEYFTDLGVKILLDRIKKDLKDFRVEFDVWTSEKKIRESGRIEECLRILNEQGNTYEAEGALWLKTSKYGDDKDRVIVKNDKTYTYFTPDIAYHLDKLDRGYDKLINVFGADHHGYVSRLKASIEALGYDKNKLDVKLLQMVKLIKDGEEIKMSKRTGKTITITELLEEVGVNASRYFFANKSLDTQMNFDITLATKQSNENPVYYVEYAHARICSILNNVSKIEKIEEYKTLNSSYAFELLNKVYEFKNIVETAAVKQMPHLITNYVYELATLFHSYYAHEKIVSDDTIYTSERINLIKTVKITIKNALNLIGVEALEKM
ncbi:MAG: arginine--tRNA ligase [Bacilli bacterium]|nr:arginine--tRNA ligase [Bacilli bacterium]